MHEVTMKIEEYRVYSLHFSSDLYKFGAGVINSNLLCDFCVR